MIDKVKAEEMYRKGEKLEVIADAVGSQKQRIWELAKREGWERYGPGPVDPALIARWRHRLPALKAQIRAIAKGV